MRGFKIYLAAALSCTACGAARAEISDNVVRVGVLNDISGIFQDTNGMGSVEAARMAAEDFAGGRKNIKVEIVYADHQNKADVGSAIVRKWLDIDHVELGLNLACTHQFVRSSQSGLRAYPVPRTVCK